MEDNASTNNNNETGSGGTHILLKIAAILISALAFTAIVGAVLSYQGIPVTIPKTIGIIKLIDIFVPLVFSLLIAILYWQLVEVQQDETEIFAQQRTIQQKQRKIEEQQNRPYVVVEDAHYHHGERSFWAKASNFGPAPATNISFGVRLVTPESTEWISSNRMARESDEYNGFVGLGDFLRPDDEYISFKAEYPQIDWPSHITGEYDTIVAQAGLKYNDIREVNYFHELWEAELSQPAPTNFEDITWEFVRDTGTDPGRMTRLSKGR